MPPLVPNDTGFTADLRITPAPKERHGHRGPVSALVVIIASLFIGVILIPSADEGAVTESNGSQQSVIAVNYQWKVYLLNQTARSETLNGTAFCFRTEDLPHEFATIQFGDFRTDTAGQGIYYGGCGILVQAFGSSATIVLRENDGKFISAVSYNGQDPVVFSGERISVSYPSATTSYFGTDMIVQDWMNGTWSPDQGIFVEHPDDVTMAGSEFYIMLFEPEGDIEIPEFQDLSLVLVLLLGTLVMIRSKASRKTL